MATRRLSTLIQIGGAVASSLGSAIRGVTRSLGSVGGAVRTLEGLQRRLNERIGAYIRQGRDINTLARVYGHVRRAAEDLRRTQERLNQATQAMNANRQQAAGLRGDLMDAVGIAAAAGAPVVVAANFEQAMARVGAISRASDEDLARLTATARQLGATTEWSASDAARGMQFLAMSGFQVQESIDAMPGLLSLATAGAVDLGEASDIAAFMVRGFGLQASEMGRVADVMTNTFTSSNTNLTMLGETMRYVAPAAAAVGMSIEEAAAAAGLLGNAGIQGSAAGTALRAMIARLAGPTGQSAEIIRELGIQTVDASGNLRRMNDILVDFQRAMQGMGTGTQAQIMSTVFGLEAMSAATVLIGQAGTGNLRSFTESVSASGSAAQVAARQSATTIGAWKELQSAVEENAIIFGDILLPVVTQVVDWLSQLGLIIAGLAQRYPHLTRAVVLLASALVTMRIVAIAGAYGLTLLQGVMITARIVMLRLGAAVRLVGMTMQIMGTLAAANPVGAIVTAIAIAALLLWYYWEPISAWWAGLWSDIKLTAHFVWEWIKETLGWNPMDYVMPFWTPVAQFFSATWSSISAGAGVVWGYLQQLLSWGPFPYVIAAWMPVLRAFEVIWESVMGAAKACFDWILGTIGYVADQISWLIGTADPNASISSEGEMRVDAQGNPIGPAAATGDGAAATGTPGTAIPAIAPVGGAAGGGGLSPGMAALLAEQGTPGEMGQLPQPGAMPDIGAIAPGGRAGSVTNNVEMNVTQQPFENSEQFARRVADMLAEQTQQDSGALYDGGAG